ncbi:uncharacterized protein LOC131880826 [Tigriopus californicus]|uniref:uncharacterized protein LOC131880826 n=1 Tax=Tigriopus californicus TaxID=6832 RepID=UPI0027DA243C|nr:uncharacterized protein LOC131880826 [Tigriopus californicus]
MAITICPSFPSDYNLNVSTEYDKNFKELEKFVDPKNMANTSSFHTTWGFVRDREVWLCATITPSKNNRIGFDEAVPVIFSQPEPPKSTFVVFIHDNRVIFPTVMNLAGVFKKNFGAVSDITKFETSFAVTRESWKLLPDHNPCSDDSLPLFTCVEHYVAQKIGCRPPWIEEAQIDKPVCSLEAEFKEDGQIYKVLTESTMDQIHNLTKCRLPCSYFKYNAEMTFQHRCHEGSRVQFYMDSESYNEVEQVLAYSLLSLLADIGGFMGLLLGVSLWTSLESIRQKCVR